MFASKTRLPSSFILSLMMVLCLASTAFGYTEPSDGDLFYEAYDLIVNSILDGPLGIVIALCMFLGGLFLLIQGKGFLLPFICVVGAALVVKSKDIIVTFGFTIPEQASQMVSLATVAIGF